MWSGLDKKKIIVLLALTCFFFTSVWFVSRSCLHSSQTEVSYSAFGKIHAQCPEFTSGMDASTKWRMMVTTTVPKFLMILHPKGELISDAVMQYGAFDIGGGSLMLKYIKSFSGQVVLDCGANIGSLALLFAAAGFETHAFEPQRTNFNLLQCSSRLNGFHGKNMFVYNQAVGLLQGTSVCLDAVDQNMGSSTVSSEISGNCKSVPVISLDNFALRNQHFRNRIALLKIDVEGFEPNLLKGAAQLLRSEEFRPKIISIELSCARWKSRFQMECIEVLNLISKNGYKLDSPEDAKSNLPKFIQDNFNSVPDLIYIL
jgi:FkbM family methyltransferase